MDLVSDLDLNSPDVIAAIAQRRVAHEEQQQNLAGIAAATPGAPPHVNVPWNDEMSRQILVQLNNARRQQQRLAFPLSDNLSALIFVSLADLTQDQRNTLTSIMTQCGRTLAQYNVQELRDLFLEMFCTTKTAVDNPMMQPSGMAQRRSFLVIEEGEIDGTNGYWAEDEDDGAEGFLEALEDVFWVYDDAEYTWYQRRFQGRQTTRGKGKGMRKGKGKAEEEEDSSDQEDPKAEEKEEEKAALTWWEKKDMKKIGKKKKTGMIPMTAIGPMIKTGMMAIGPQKNCTTRMSMVISRRKEKERKARKARMMKEKEENQEMEKASQTMSNLNPHQLRPFKTLNLNRLIILLQPRVQGMFFLLLLKLTQHVLMCLMPAMKNRVLDALVEEVKTKEMLLQRDGKRRTSTTLCV